ncbi:MAG: hypothetical protein WAW17_21025, partial [Rhodococcus sp. (in: high G+C Gram-positive bacteria)]|uniref:hypothetical protein n=1 Tax=Rhodococcus sp. TaxID=1831 RepID=UPI003BAF6F1A
MNAIWMQAGDGVWKPAPSAPYENEAALHGMVMGTPELLPLSGSPRITVVGREITLPMSGRADVLAVEADGRPIIIEVKLNANNEARRAVVAQA